MSLQGKSIIVTGGASGMGRASALLMASRGARVAIADVDAQQGEEVVSQIKAAGGTALFRATDVTSRPQVLDLVRATLDAFGRIDVLAHVAAIAVHRPFLEIDDELWHRTVDVCLNGTFYVNQEVARVMVAQKGGRIINFASTVAATGGELLPAYSAAKGGVVALSKTMQKELAPHNIIVTLVAPGATDTPLYRRGRSGQQLDSMARHMRFGRPAAAAEVAEVVAFLADDATAHILAGQTIHTNGASFMGF